MCGLPNKTFTTTNTPTQNLALERVVNSVIPVCNNSNVTYNKEHNIFLANGYTSAAGNTYFQGIRLSDRLVVLYDFGQGWAHLFLNGIRLYGFDGKEKKLLTARSYHCVYFNESSAERESVNMLTEFLKGQARMLKSAVSGSQIEEFAKALVQSVKTQKQLGQ